MKIVIFDGSPRLHGSLSTPGRSAGAGEKLLEKTKKCRRYACIFCVNNRANS